MPNAYSMVTSPGHRGTEGGCKLKKATQHLHVHGQQHRLQTHRNDTQQLRHNKQPTSSTSKARPVDVFAGLCSRCQPAFALDSATSAVHNARPPSRHREPRRVLHYETNARCLLVHVWATMALADTHATLKVTLSVPRCCPAGPPHHQRADQSPPPRPAARSQRAAPRLFFRRLCLVASSGTDPRVLAPSSAGLAVLLITAVGRDPCLSGAKPQRRGLPSLAGGEGDP